MHFVHLYLGCTSACTLHLQHQILDCSWKMSCAWVPYTSGVEHISGSPHLLYVFGVWCCSGMSFFGGIYHLLWNQILPTEHQFRDLFSYISCSTEDCWDKSKGDFHSSGAAKKITRQGKEIKSIIGLCPGTESFSTKNEIRKKRSVSWLKRPIPPMYLELANIPAAPHKMLLSMVYNLCICFLHDETKQRHAHEKHTGIKLSELNSSFVQFQQHFSVGFECSTFTEESGLSWTCMNQAKFVITRPGKAYISFLLILYLPLLTASECLCYSHASLKSMENLERWGAWSERN